MYQKTEQEFCQKVRREKIEDQTRRSNIWKTGDIRKEDRENEGEEINGLIQNFFQEQENSFQTKRLPQSWAQCMKIHAQMHHHQI